MTVAGRAHGGGVHPPAGHRRAWGRRGALWALALLGTVLATADLLRAEGSVLRGWFAQVGPEPRAPGEALIREILPGRTR